MAIRTGQQYLDGLRKTERDVWVGDEKIESVADHPLLSGAAKSIAGYFDLRHAEPEVMTTTDPDNGERIGWSHVLPRSVDDLRQRGEAFQLAAELSMGVMGRTPDYMNATFAGFASDRTRWAGPDDSNAEGYKNLVAFQRRLRRDDLSLTHTIVHPTVDKATDGVYENNPVPLHKVDETTDSIIVRGGRMLASLAPFADEQTVYPGAPLPPDGPPEYALAFTIAMDAPGLVFLCRDTGSREAAAFDAPFSTRFDEQDAYCIFDDVEIPKANLFINGNIDTYNSVMLKSPWWQNVMQQTTIRALTKMEFLYRLAGRMAEAVNDNSEKTMDLLGEIHTYVEMTRSALVASIDHAETWDDGGVFPEGRAVHPVRALMPKWMVRINEILKTIGGANLLAAPSRAQLDDPRIAALAQELLPGANGMAASDRSEIFRVAWDFIGSALGSRNELYERHYLGSPLRTHTSIERFYSTATRARGDELLEKVLADNRSRQQR